MFAKSIRGRLVTWIAFLLLVILGGFGVTAYQLYQINRMRQIDEQLERRLAAVSAAVRRPSGLEEGGPRSQKGPPGLGPPPRFEPDRTPLSDFREPPFDRREIRLPRETLSQFNENDTNGFYFAIWGRQGALLKGSTNVPADLTIPDRSRADLGPRTQTRGSHREIHQFTEIGECVLVGCCIQDDQDGMRHFAGMLGLAGALVLGIGLGGGWWLATRAIRPVADISTTAARIAEGNLSERINVSDTDGELGQLAGVLNSTFTRLEGVFEQQRQFTADAAHELRTPLTVMITETQTALAQDRSAEDYRDTVRACLESAQQMRRLTGALLALARLDARQRPSKRGRLDLADQTRACVESLRPLAAERDVSIQTDLHPAEVTANEDEITPVITNLLTNAIHYNRHQGEVSVNLRQRATQIVLTVTDTGDGIAAEDLPHIFKRFYRADKSRSRTEGHLGLGLAIVKAMVEALGGSIEVESERGAGSTFTVKLPAAGPRFNPPVR